MRLFLLSFLLLAGCTGALNGAPTHFTVRVRDEAHAPIAEAVVILELDEDGNDEVCGVSASDGVAELTWDECEFDVFDCDSHPFRVRASKEGYQPASRAMGFSQERDIDLTLEACDGECAAPETCDA